MTIIWCMVPEIRSTTDIIFCHSGPFLPINPPMDSENQTFSKNGKNTWRYYHFPNINDHHMMCGSSDVECNGQNLLSFWTIFCPFTPLKTRKIKIWKNEKKHLECNINHHHMMYGFWDMERVTDRTFCHFRPFFALLPP